MDTFLQDLKHSLRMFRRSPGFAFTAVAALALGIGANTAIFSVVNTVLLRPLRYRDPDRIVLLMTTSSGGPIYAAAETKFNVWRSETSVLQNVSAYRFGIANLTGVEHPEQIATMQVTLDYFRALGLPIARGRAFTAAEEQPDAHAVILSDGLWRRAFGGDPGILGRGVSLGGSRYDVIGIMAPGLWTENGPSPDAWLPFPISAASSNQTHYFYSVGRLAPGVTLAMANAQLQLAAGAYRRNYPNGAAMGPHAVFGVTPMRDALIGDVRPSLWVLAGAVGFVLLIACANVANLLLVRAAGRKREIAIRIALGASRTRLVRQLLTESVALSATGGALGLALGMAGIRGLLVLNPGDIPRIGPQGASVTMDWRVLVFAVLVSLSTGILFGLYPALQSSRAISQSAARFRPVSVRSTLVISEVALALILLVGAALLIRTFLALRAVNPGFDRRNVLTMNMSLSGARLEKTDGIAGLVRDGIERLSALPGVAGAAAAFSLPMEVRTILPFAIVGRPLTGASHGFSHWVDVSPGFFDVLKIPIIRGRAFTGRDDGGAGGVAIVNQAMARQYWPDPQGQDPLNQRILVAGGVGGLFQEPVRQIVGIAADVHDDGLDRGSMPAIYVPVAQVSDAFNRFRARSATISWIVRTRVEPYSLSAAIQDELRQASGGLPVARTRSLDEVVAQSTARRDFNMLMLAIFGGSALLLAALGIYGLMAYATRQRTQEIGIRLALGAREATVRNMVVIQGMRLALVGVAIGIGAAFGLTRLMAVFLFGVKARDPLVFTIVPVLLSAVAFLAVWMPARRASRIDPAIALRCE